VWYIGIGVVSIVEYERFCEHIDLYINPILTLLT